MAKASLVRVGWATTMLDALLRRVWCTSGYAAYLSLFRAMAWATRGWIVPTAEHARGHGLALGGYEVARPCSIHSTPARCQKYATDGKGAAPATRSAVQPITRASALMAALIRPEMGNPADRAGISHHHATRFHSDRDRLNGKGRAGIERAKGRAPDLPLRRRQGGTPA